jgi:hypothetical protein
MRECLSETAAMPDLGASKISPLHEQERSAHWAKLSTRVHGVFASAKNGCSIPWATHDQRCLMYLLEVDPFGHARPKNEAEERVDRRHAENQTCKRMAGRRSGNAAGHPYA